MFWITFNVPKGLIWIEGDGKIQLKIYKTQTVFDALN